MILSFSILYNIRLLSFIIIIELNVPGNILSALYYNDF